MIIKLIQPWLDDPDELVVDISEMTSVIPNKGELVVLASLNITGWVDRLIHSIGQGEQIVCVVLVAKSKPKETV